MVFFMQLHIPDKALVTQGVQLIKGLGRNRALEVCRRAGLGPDIRAKDLNPVLQVRLKNAITDSGFLIGQELDRKVREDIQKLVRIGSYRGLRHRQSLPVRGQRSKTNARTQRKFKRTL